MLHNRIQNGQQFGISSKVADKAEARAICNLPVQERMESKHSYIWLQPGRGWRGTSDFWNGRANVLIWSLKFGLGKIVSGLKFQGPKACLFGVGNLG